MDAAGTLGHWMKQRRKALDLTQDELARRVGCAAETIRKIEASRLRPSRQIADLLADHLAIPAAERAAFIALARSGPRASPHGQPHIPYVGLHTYHEADVALFFGREALVAAMVEQLRDRGLLVVLGPSGSGKSSVVLAGLLPALKRGALPCSERWTYITLKPGPRPLESLAAALDQLRNRAGDPVPYTLADDQALLRVAERLGLAPGERLVLVVDQFEELWSLVPAEPAARAAFAGQQQQPFIRLLLAAAGAGSITIVLTMRADFLHRAAEDSALAHAIGQHDIVVGPMSVDELRQAIERPAQLAGGAWAPGLADELIAQVAGRPGALPLLEYTLLELWKSRRSDGMLTWEAFRALGGVEGALAARADAIVATHYDQAQQEQLRQILVRLVQPGENVADTRRRVPLDDLVLAGSSLEIVRDLLEPLIDERLLVASKMLDDDESLDAADDQGLSSDDGRAVVEIAHEALIRAWPTFGRWIDAARDDLRIQLQIEAVSKEWAANGESDDFLWGGAQLARAATWLDRTWLPLNQRDQRFLDASREHEQARMAAEAASQRERERLLAERQAEQRHARRLRLFLAAISGLLIAALILALFAFDRRQAALRAEAEAQQARTEAEDAARAVQSAADAGAALFELDRRPEQAVLLALAALPPDHGSASPLVARALYRTFEATQIRRILAGDAGAVRVVAWSPDGRQVLTGGDDAIVRIWDSATGRLIQQLAGHDGPVRAAAWSPGGQMLLTGGADGHARIWDAATGRVVHVLRGHSSWVSAVAWSPDGQQALTGSYDTTARIWQSASGSLVRTFAGHTGPIRTVAWSPDGGRVLSGGDDKTARIWNAETGSLVRTLKSADGGVWSAAWHPKGQQIATGGDHAAQIWDVTTGSPLQKLDGQLGRIWSIAWRPDGQQLLTGSFDGTVWVWDMATVTAIEMLRGHTGKIWSVAWRSSGDEVATGSDDGTARVWDLNDRTATCQSVGDADAGNLISWSLDGRRALRWSPTAVPVVWDTGSSSSISTLDMPANELLWIAWFPGGSRALLIDADRSVHIWDIASGKAGPEVGGAAAMADWAAVSPDGHHILLGGNDGTARIWDIGSASIARTFDTQLGLVRSVAWSPDGRQVALGATDGNVRRWDVATGAALPGLIGHTNLVRWIAWSPDAQLIATASDDRTVRIWDAGRGALAYTLEGHTGGILSGAWDSTGRRIVTGSDDGTVRLWDAGASTAVRILEKRIGTITWVGWSDDGRQVLVGSEQGYHCTWLASDDLIVADLTRRLCDLVSDETIHRKIPTWRGCTTELADRAPDLATFDALRAGK